MLQQNNVRDNRFFHGGQANATSSSYLKHDVLLHFLGCKVVWSFLFYSWKNAYGKTICNLFLWKTSKCCLMLSLTAKRVVYLVGILHWSSSKWNSEWLASCAEAHTERVVLTSTVGALIHTPKCTPEVVVDESWWSDEDYCWDNKVCWICWPECASTGFFLCIWTLLLDFFVTNLIIYCSLEDLWLYVFGTEMISIVQDTGSAGFCERERIRHCGYQSWWDFWSCCTSFRNWK
jgi:hypothetical protein